MVLLQARLLLFLWPAAIAFIVPNAPRLPNKLTTRGLASDGTGSGPSAGAGGDPYSRSQWLDLAQGGGSTVEVSDTYESEYSDQTAELEYFADEELLEKYRQERQSSLDQWQFNQMVREQQGSWSGIWSDYIPVDDVEQPLEGGRRKAEFKLVSIHRGRSTLWADMEARKLGWVDEVLGQDLSGRESEPVVVDKVDMQPHDLRAMAGAMAVGGAFTRCTMAVGEKGEELMAPEVWLADKGTRVRCRFIYSAPPGAPTFKLRKVVVMKEREGVKGLTCEEPALWGPDGKKEYDPINVAPNHWRFVTSGRLCLSFPPMIPRDEAGAVIVDWEAGQMRYQADRKFKRFDGTLDTLELTEISAADSKIYTL